MVRPSTLALATSLFATDAQALQSGWSNNAVVDLGTYRVATDEWIRQDPAGETTLPQNSIYDNTCVPGNKVLAVEYTGQREILVDTGQIPGRANTTLGIDPALLHDEYLVQGWRWTICPSEVDVPNEPGPISATMFWWDCLDSCRDGGDFQLLTPTASITIDGIPGGGSSGTCFVFDVDIRGTGLEFELTGDCDTVFDGPAAGAVGDTFGYGMTVQRTDGAPLASLASVGLGGDPGTQTSGFGCQQANRDAGPAGFIGESTSFLNRSRHEDSSTGIGNGEDGVDAQGGSISGCFSFGYFAGFPGVPYVGLFHELYGEPAFELIFPELCSGDGGDQTGCSDCPCGNNSAPGTIGGCLNSAGRALRLRGSGMPSVAADTLRFGATGGPASVLTVLSSGNDVAPNNAANPCFGLDSGVNALAFDGLRCAVAATRRHGGRPTDDNGAVGMTNNGWGGVSAPPGGLVAQGGYVAGQTRHYQLICRDNLSQVCGRGLNTSQSVSVLFVP